VIAALQTLLAISYPPLIYVGLTVMSPRQVALIVGGTVVLRLLLSSPAKLAAYTRIFWLPVIAMSSISVAAAASNQPFGLLLTPVAINFGMLVVFASSFLQDETTVERLAKIQVPDLPARELEYCRRVTAVWCGFFLLNGGTALGLAFLGDLGLWTLYNGVIGYILMGALFAAEYLYRRWRFRRYVGAPLDPILKRFFPPRDELATDAVPSSVGLDPEKLAESRGAGFIHQDLCVPQNLSVWPGHFPEYAIVPGVLQLRWVLSGVYRLTGNASEIEAFEALKFKRPLLPGQKFRLEVQVTERDSSRIRFRLADGESVFSSGVLCLRGRDSP
jgi:uncharacterized membrane protein/3-hydroxymyristoyl/3-hydroxydecanoyl-(acyl carrier protein) dehydratase